MEKCNNCIELSADEKDTDSTSTESYSSDTSGGEEAGKYVRRIKDSSDEEPESMQSEDGAEKSDDDDMQKLKERYQSLLTKFEQQRKKKKQSSRRLSVENSRKPLAERIRGWQAMELTKCEGYKEQYHAWVAFKSSVEANWILYDIKKDAEKLICLQTKCKGFIVELINAIHRGKPTFKEVWGGLQTQFFAPIDSGEETSIFYQLRQNVGENIFSFYERVTKQAYLCNFSESECAKRIGETFARNCLNPAFFLGIFEEFNDLDKLKHHARNFHAAMPKPNKSEPVLAISNQQYMRPSVKRGSTTEFDESHKRRRFFPLERGDYQHQQACKFCGRQNCNRRNCVARGKRCSYCNRFDHFEIVCMRKKADSMKNNPVNAIGKEEEVNVDENQN